VIDYDRFDGTCDSTIAAFETAKEDAKDLYDLMDEASRLIMSQADEHFASIRDALAAWEDRFANGQAECFQDVQENLIALKNWVRYYQESIGSD
jgi:hypothetical protein